MQPILSGCTDIFVLDKVWTCASRRLQYCTQPNKHIIGLFAFRDWPAARAMRNRQTKDGFDRRGEAEAVWRGLRHHPGSHQSEVLFHWPPCECYLSTRKYVWKVLPFISCWCSECHCEGISHAEQGKAQDGTVSDLWESWIKCAASVCILYVVLCKPMVASCLQCAYCI